MPIFKTKKAEMENDIFPLFSIIKGEREERIGKSSLVLHSGNHSLIMEINL
jgi:hypothetical protein